MPGDLPLFVAGKIWTLRIDAEALMDLGADVVSLGRSAIANPDWPRRITEPGWEPKRPPLTIAEPEARGLSAPFAGYMRHWKGFVAD